MRVGLRVSSAMMEHAVLSGWRWYAHVPWDLKPKPYPEKLGGVFIWGLLFLVSGQGYVLGWTPQKDPQSEYGFRAYRVENGN